MTLDKTAIRAHFPALEQDAIFMDTPAGSQVARQVIERINDYLLTKNANVGGLFPTSQSTDALVAEARQVMAEFFNARSADEIVFGPNMTSLTFKISRVLAQDLGPGDEIVVTRLDHDANISPWMLVARDRGCTLRWLDFDPEDCTLRLDQLTKLLNPRTRLVAIGLASNATGTINPAGRIIQQVRQLTNALVYIDAVQYAPHGPIDVQQLDCDFLVVSAYKFFGPHVGILYGKYDLLERLQAYRLRPAPEQAPGKFETGTANFEGLAGLLGAMDYLADFGESYAQEHAEGFALRGRPLFLKTAMSLIRAHEMELSRRLLQVLQGIEGLRIYGICDPLQLDRRVPTFAFRLADHSPAQTASYLAENGIFAWNGNYYALAVTERLGVEAHGGMVRVGLAHYHTEEEISQLGAVLARLAEK